MTDQDEVQPDQTDSHADPYAPPQLLPARIPPWGAVSIPLIIAAIVFAAGGGLRDLILIFGVVIGACAIVMIHEGGHFLAGKLCGMKITEYFVGFGPRIWSFKRGEIEYGVKSIPLGGYVKIIGMTNLEEVPPEDEARSYRAQPYYQRAFVTFAGILCQFILAYVLILVSITTFGVEDKAILKVDVLTELKQGQTPAQAAGFKVGDKIISVDDAKPKNWDALVKYIQSHQGIPVQVVISRNGHLMNLTTTPADYSEIVKQEQNTLGVKPTVSDKHYGFVGIGPATSFKKIGLLQAPAHAGGVLATATGHYIVAFSHVIVGVPNLYHAIVNDPRTNDANRPASPVAITRVAGHEASKGFVDVLGLIIGINIGIAVFNLIPLLPLDGGHVAIALYEAIRSRKGKRYIADFRKMAPFMYAFLTYLAFFVLAGLYLDIFRGVPGLDH